MRQPTRPFTVEIKSSRKMGKKNETPSLWAGVDLAGASRKVSAELEAERPLAIERQQSVVEPAAEVG